MRTGEVGQNALTCLCSGQFQKYVYILLAKCFSELWVSVVASTPDLPSILVILYVGDSE